LALAISGAALQLYGNQTDSFTLKGAGQSHHLSQLTAGTV